ncbi:MAG TPA: nucleotide exchange factor GrpE [Candidatus Acidoferrales bacterium]|nr:nucleotide exchange factor GrpE [Candidatus Acidoferrales bacterium]
MSSHSHKQKEADAEAVQPVDPPAPKSDGGVTEADRAALAEQVQKLQAEKQELTETLVRRQADFENYRKRIEKERHHDRHRAAEAIIEHLLPVLDAFDRALADSSDPAYVEYRKGFELIRRQLWETLAKQGLVRIEPVGQHFNPHFHHAIARVETTEHADGIVIGELQPGYMFHDKVLRPAMVRVACAPAEQTAHHSRRDN